MSLLLSICHIVGNHMPRLKYAHPLSHCLFQVVKGLVIMMVMQLNLSGKKTMSTKLQGKTLAKAFAAHMHKVSWMGVKAQTLK